MPARRILSGLMLAAAAAGGLCVLTPSHATAAPEPSPIPRRWQVDIETSPLRVILMNDAQGKLRPFFYMTYVATNNSVSDLLFAPMFELATDSGDVIRGGRDVPFSVTQSILTRINDPAVLDQIAIVGNLMRGEENAKQGVVIFAAPTLHLSELTLYAAGFSGETAAVEVPNPETGKMERKVLRKTLELTYRVEGDLTGGRLDPLTPFDRRWIMR